MLKRISIKNTTKFFMVLFFITLVINVILYAYKRESTLSHADYKVLVQESAGSSNYVEYPGYNFPKRGYTLASYTCDSNATITQNNISKALSFTGAANRCTLKFNISSITTSQTLQKLQELSSQWNVNDGTPDFSKTSPVPVYVDNGFNGNSVNVGLVNENYITYAASYTFNTETGKYSLTNAASCQVSNVLCRQYIENGYYVVDVTGVASSTPVTSTNLDKIYKITDTHGTWTGSYSADYIESSVLTNYNYSDCGIYHSTDDYGTSYYVRGAYDYNYVKFGKNSSNQDLYWRIVRINGDESLRMIYAGTSATAKSDIGKSKFNETQDDNTYVGYMTGTTGASSYALAHNNSSNSTIKTTLDNWYNENLLEDDDKIEYGLFCNDRSLQSGNGYGMDTTYYKSYNRNITNKAPSLLCPEKNDRFTVNDTNIGNGKLTRPIGLITEDELAYGGMVNNKSNTIGYLSKTDSYWTMTPADFVSEKAWVMGYYQNQLKALSTNSNMGVVPVINLTPEAVQAFTGTGTASNPFVISEEGSSNTPVQTNLPTLQILQNLNPNITVNSGTPNFGNAATTDEGIYAAEDDYGTSYYWRGAATTNYIKFGDWYWRIVRINGDGSLRLFYDGSSINARDNIGHSNYYSVTSADVGHVGYMRGTSSNTDENALKNETNSNVKTAIDNWYSQNISGKEFEDDLSDTIFCNDKQYEKKTKFGITMYQFEGYNRINQDDSTNIIPTLKCNSDIGSFTVSDTTKGNGKLTFPISIISMDEALMAGVPYSTSNMSVNTSHYLYRSYSYWTMTPHMFFSGSAHIADYIDNQLNTGVNTADLSIVPVINIKNEAIQDMTGSGTSSDPFVVH